MVDWLLCTHNHIVVHILRITGMPLYELYVNVSNYNPYIKLQLPGLDYQRTALHLLPRAGKTGESGWTTGNWYNGNITKSVVHVAPELLSMLELLAKLCNFHSMSTLCCSLENVFEDYHQTSIPIPILNPKSFMVINSELKVAPSGFQSPTIKGTTWRFCLEEKT